MSKIIVRHESDVPKEDVTAFGSTKTTIQWLTSEKDPEAKWFAMRRFVIQPGGHIGLHHHPWEHEIFVLEGEGVLLDDEGNKTQVKAGDAILVPGGIPHAYEVVGDKPFVFLCNTPHKKLYENQSNE